MRTALLRQLALVMLGAAVLTLPSPAGATAVAAGVRSEADWLLSAQLPDGAIPTTVGSTAVWPYLSNYAASGLARAGGLTGDVRYSEGAWKWLTWYQAHENEQGFVSDYSLAGDRELTTGAEDSTDAYAGTFLLALHSAWQASHDAHELQRFTPGMDGAVRAIEATQDADGLTWAKPSFRVKYLIDQAEAYAGLRAAGELALAAGAPWLALRSMLDAKSLADGVARLWNPGTGAYDWALHDGGARQATDWSVLYPDAIAQAWAVAFGLVPAARARELMDRFAGAQPGWDQPAALARFEQGTSTVGYWPVVGSAFAAVGDASRSGRAAAKIESVVHSSRRAWPFSAASAGQLILLASVGPVPPADHQPRLLSYVRMLLGL